jgi:hypothetical protein
MIDTLQPGVSNMTMPRTSLPFGSFLIFIFGLLACLGGTALGQTTIVHDTQSEFATGAFSQTVLQGSEAAPEIRLDSYPQFAWTFEDDALSGWTLRTQPVGNGVAEIAPAGQIHLRSAWVTEESFALATRTDIGVSPVCVAEWRVFLDAIGPSNVGGPYNQPQGASCRLDVALSTGGFRMDIFTDRMASFYRNGSTGYDYPTLTSVDITTNPGQWYTYRFELDLNAMTAQVYRDGVYVGQFLADARNAAPNTLRVLAYSRASVSGLAECHLDFMRLGTQSLIACTSGTYTSAVMPLNVSQFGALSWSGSPASPYPWGPWVKSPGNPILPATCLNENMVCDLNDPLQQPLQIDGEYWMVYSNASDIRLAHTADPNLMTWASYAGNPILSPGLGPNGQENYVYSPNLFRDGSTWYLFYDVSLTADGRQRNAYATAPALTGPWTKGQIVVDRGAVGQWDDYRVSEPFIWKEGDTYFLYYMGDTGCSNEQVGLATTPASLFPLGPEPGGLWTKYGLVLPYSSSPTAWDRGLVADPSVIRVGDVFYMRYTGSTTNAHWQLGTAWATNPYGPWHRPPVPDITLGPAGSWDDDRLVRGAIHFHNGKWYSPYTGNDGSAYRGGIASADPAAADDYLGFETRTSVDGVAWQEWRAAANGATIPSSPARYLQYRATMNVSAGNSPVLTAVSVQILATATPVPGEGLTPQVAALHDVYPNPFNPQTAIVFDLPRQERVRLWVYGVDGQLVRTLIDTAMPAGRHTVTWDGRDGAGAPVGSGLYLCTMEAGAFQATRKMTLLK